MRALLHPTRIVLILAVVAVAAVPAVRRELVWNARLLGRAIPHWPGSEYVHALLGWEAGPSTADPGWAALLEAHPRDLQLRIAAASSRPWTAQTQTQQRALHEARGLAPGNRVVLSLAALSDLRARELSFDREESLGGRRAERRERWPAAAPPSGKAACAPPKDLKPTKYPERLLTPRQIVSPVKDLDAWAQADSDNAAPDVFAAYLLLGAKQDDEALARAERASRKRYCTLYGLDIMRAQAHAARLRGAPPARAAITAGEQYTESRLYVRLKNFARIMQAIGWDRFEAGDKQTAFRYWLTTARIGKLMAQHERETFLPPLVGVATMAIGYAPIYRFTRPPEAKAKFAGGDYLPKDAHSAFVAARGRKAADRIYAELVSGQSLRDQMREASKMACRHSLSLYRYLDASRLKMIALPSALMVLMLWIFVLLASRRLQPALSKRWRAILIVLGIVVPLGLAVGGRAMCLVGAGGG